jgi:predicted lipoprotein with Yx(FWY)xxD motif
MKRKVTMFIAAAFPLAIVLIVAACGGSTSGSTSGSPYSSGPYGSAVKASAPNGIARVTKVGTANSSLGGIVVDSKGRSLYLFENDNIRHSTCYGQCATYWPPLLSHGKPLARAGLRQSLLGTTQRANGSDQVTYAGHPLYRFLPNRTAGETRGVGSHPFGAGWDVLSPAGNKIESDD